MPLYEAWEVFIISRRWRITNTPWLMRVLFRSIYVLCTTLIAATFPFFEGVKGEKGGVFGKRVVGSGNW